MGHIMPRLCKMGTRWLCHYISLWVISMFTEPVLKATGRHTHIFTAREILTVGFAAFPIVDTVCCIASYCLLDLMFVSRCCTNYAGCVVHSVWADLAGFPTSFPSRSLLVGPPLQPLVSGVRVQFRLAKFRKKPTHPANAFFTP